MVVTLIVVLAIIAIGLPILALISREALSEP
jgi:hypothetical protein